MKDVKFIHFLTIFVVCISALLLGYALFQSLEHDVKLDASSLIIGTFINAFMVSIQFWFGSSNGSKEKDKAALNPPPTNVINNNNPDNPTTVTTTTNTTNTNP